MHTVTVLMSTYNGEKYLIEQIESLLNQKKVKLHILVRDDGSTDNTLKILNTYQEKGCLVWYTGENLRSAKSFMDLIMNAPESEYYAFCDQDDVWNEDKLYRATKILGKNNKIEPRLYCSNYQLVNEQLEQLPDNGHVSTTTFNAALVSSCCTGCTVVFNNYLKKILQKKIPQVIVMHDDWAHKVCLAVGGTVYYDTCKTLMYRQHKNNVDGGLHDFKSRINKIITRIVSKDRLRSKQIEELLEIYKNMMPMENRRLAEKIAGYYEKNMFERMKIILDKQIGTPYKKKNRGFRMAIMLKYY